VRIDKTFRLISLAPDGQRALATITDNSWSQEMPEPPEKDDAAQMWSVESWQPITPLMVPKHGTVRNAALSPDGTRVVMGASEIWDAQSGERLPEPLHNPNRDAAEIVFRHDGSAFATIAEVDGTRQNQGYEIRLQVTADGQPISTPMVDSRIGTPYSAFHPRGVIIASAGRAVRLWDTSSGVMLSPAISLSTANDPFRGLNRDRTTIFSADGRRLYMEAGDSLWVMPLGEVSDGIPSDEVLQAWSEILSGRRIDAAGGMVPMAARDFTNAWQALQSNRGQKR
jgi:WD40 repeat protein